MRPLFLPTLSLILATLGVQHSQAGVIMYEYAGLGPPTVPS